MKKLLFLIFFFGLTAAGTAYEICFDTLRPDANGSLNTWDDANTAGCAATASNYLRVNTNSTTDTVAIDTIATICNTGSLKESHHCADFVAGSRIVYSIDSVAVLAKMWGTIATDSARIGMMIDNGTVKDTIWGSRFQLTTTPAFYRFVSHTNPHGNGWEDVNVDSTQTVIEGRLAVAGRIFSTEEFLQVRSQVNICTNDGIDPGAQAAEYFYLTQGQFAVATVTGNQTVDTGVDSLLKGIRIYGTTATSEGFSDNQSQFFGIAVSASAQKGLAWVSEDGAVNTRLARRSGDSALIFLESEAGVVTVNGAARFDSFGTGGNAGKFYLNWVDAPSAAWLCYFEAYYGSSLTNVNVTEHTITAAAGSNQAFTGVGFQPQYIFLMHSLQTTRGGANGLSVGFGQATSASNQNAVTNGALDADGAGGFVSESHQAANRAILCLENDASPAIDNALSFISFDSDGFTLRVDTKTTNNCLLWAMSFRGGQYQVGGFDSPTAGGVPQDQSVTTTFRPAGASFMHATTTTLNADIAEAHLGFGGGNDSLAAGAISEQTTWGITDNVRNLTVTGKRNASTKCITFGAPGSPPTLIAEADYKTQTGTTFTVTWTTIGAAAHKVWYATFGPGEPPAAGAPNTRRPRLLKMGKLEENSEEAPVVDGLFDRFIR